MDLLATQTHAAKHEAQQMEAQLMPVYFDQVIMTECDSVSQSVRQGGQNCWGQLGHVTTNAQPFIKSRTDKERHRQTQSTRHV